MNDIAAWMKDHFRKVAAENESQHPSAPSPPSPSVWWPQAKALEANNQLEEAEAVLKDAIPHLGFAIQTARLYAERFERLRDANDVEGAAVAHQKAVDWAYNYASYATSGGEGAALSYERDQFIASLGPSPKG